MDGNFDDLLNEAYGILGKKRPPKVPTAPAAPTLPKSNVDWDKLKKGSDFHGFYVTSAFDGKHNPGSKHYSRKAIDLRVLNKTQQEVDEAIKNFQSMGYKVRDERRRPKGQREWTAPHIHIENTGGGGKQQPAPQKPADYSNLLTEAKGLLGNTQTPPPADYSDLLTEAKSMLGGAGTPATPGTAEYNQQVVAKGSTLPQIVYPVTEGAATNQTFNNPVAPVEPQTVLPPAPQIIEPVQTLGAVQPETVNPMALIEPPPLITKPLDLGAEYKNYSDYVASQKQTPMSYEKFAEISKNTPDLVATATAKVNAPTIPAASPSADVQDSPLETEAAETTVQAEAPTTPKGKRERLEFGIKVEKGQSVRQAIKDQTIQQVSALGYDAADVEAAFNKNPLKFGDDSRADDARLEKYQGETINHRIEKGFFDDVEKAREQRIARQEKLRQAALDKVKRGGELQDEDIDYLETQGISLKDIPRVQLDEAMSSGASNRQAAIERHQGSKYADILIKRDTGEISREQADEAIAYQDNLEADIAKETKARTTSTGGNSRGEDTFNNVTETEDQVKARVNEKLQELIKANGGAIRYYEERARIEKEYENRPLARPLEFAKNFYRAFPKAASSLLKTVDIASEVLPGSPGSIYAALTGGDNKATKGYSFQLGKALDKFVDETLLPKNKDFDNEYLVAQVPDVLGQVATQLLAGIASGGATVPVLLGSAMGASEQYEAADKAGASGVQRKLAALVGGVSAISDAIPFAKFLSPLNKVGRLAWINKFTSSVFGNAAKEVGEREAAEVAKGALSKLLSKGKTLATGALLEGSQELSEKKINDLVARMTYDPNRQVLTLSNEDIAEFFGGAIGGVGGGAVEIALTQDAGANTSLNPQSDLADSAQKVVEGVQAQTDTPSIRVIKRKPDAAEDLTGKTVETKDGGQVTVKAETTNKKRVIVEDEQGKVTTLGKNEIEVVEDAPLLTQNEIEVMQDVPAVAPVNPDNPFTFKVDAPRKKDETKDSVSEESASVATNPVLQAESPESDVSAKVEEKGEIGQIFDKVVTADNVTKDLRDKLWDKVQKGDTKELGKNSNLLLIAKKIKDAGGFAKREDFEKFLPEFFDKAANKKSDEVAAVANELFAKYAKPITDVQDVKENLTTEKEPFEIIKSDFANPTKEQIAEAKQTILDGYESYTNSDKGRLDRITLRPDEIHKLSVEKALKEGKTVPAEVLADYPDLAEKYGKTETPVQEQAADEKAEVQTETDNDVEALPVSQRVTPEDLGDDVTFKKVAESVNKEKISAKTGFTNTQAEWFVAEIQKAYDSLDRSTQLYTSASREGDVRLEYNKANTERMKMDRVINDLKRKRTDSAKQTSETAAKKRDAHIQEMQQLRAELDKFEEAKKDVITIEVPGDGTFKFYTRDGIDRIHKKLTGKTVEDFRSAEKEKNLFKSETKFPAKYNRLVKKDEAMRESETGNIEVEEVNAALGPAVGENKIASDLGLEKSSNGFWINKETDGGERFYRLAAGNKVEIEGYENFDLFIHKEDGEFKITDGITGLRMFSGNSPVDAVNNLKSFGPEKITPAIKKEVDKGNISPRYAVTDSGPLKKTSDEAAIQKELEAAHLEDVAAGMNSRIVGSDLELTPHDGEFLRRAIAEASSRESSAFDGVFFRPQDFRRLLPILRRVERQMKTAGYEPDALSKVNDLIKNLETVAKMNEGTGAMYVFEDALAEEKFHQSEFLAGGIDVEARKAIEALPIFKQTESGKFARDYGELNPADKMSEFVAKLATGQATRYGFDKTPNFDSQKRKALRLWADGVLRNNKERIEKDGLEPFLSRFGEVKKYAKIEKTDGKRKEKSGRSDGAQADSTRRSEPARDKAETADVPSAAAEEEIVFEQNLKNRQYAETLRENGRNSYQSDVAYLPESEKAWSDNARKIIEDSFAADPSNPFAQAIKEFNNKNQPDSFRAVLGVALIDHTGAIGDYEAMKKIADSTVELVGQAGQVLRASQMVSKYDFAKGVEIAARGMKNLGNELTVPEIEEIKQKTGRYARTAEEEAMMLSMIEEAKAEIELKNREIAELETANEQVGASEREKAVALEEAKKQASIAKRLATYYKNKFNKENPTRRRAVGSAILRKELAQNKDADLDILSRAFSSMLKSVSENASIPAELQDLYEKSLRFKNPKFVAVNPFTKEIAFETTWKEIERKIATFANQGKSSEWIRNKLNKDYDVHGTKKPVTVESLFNKEYNHPSELPKEVYEKARKSSLLFSDANDAIRLSRIIDTVESDRYDEGDLTVYRAVESDQFRELRAGDWVTTQEKYAQEHNERYFNGKGQVIQETVNGADVLVSPTGNFEEAIYAPLELSQPFESYQKGSPLKSVADKPLDASIRAALVRQAQRDIVASEPKTYDEVIKSLTVLTNGAVSDTDIKAIHAEAVQGIKREALDLAAMTAAERAEYEKAKAVRKVRAEHRVKANAFEKTGNADLSLSPLNRRIIKKIIDDKIPADEKERLIAATILLMKAPGAKAWHEGFADVYQGTRSENDKWFKKAVESRAEIKKLIKQEQLKARADRENWTKTIADFEAKLLNAQKAKRDAKKSLDAHYNELQKSGIEKTIDKILIVPDLMRTAMSTGEISQIGRQGYPTLLTFPSAWTESVKGLKIALGDPVKRFAYIKAIEETPRFKESVKYGMPYATFGENSVGDEHFPIDRIINKLADKDYKSVNKVPGLAPVLSGVAKLQQKFETAYTDPADLQRFLSYSIMADLIDSQGLTDDQADKAKKRAVYYSQILSGKGSLPKFFGEKSIALRLMSSIGFAPNLLASRVETAFHFNPVIALALAPKGLKGTIVKRGMSLYAVPMMLAVGLAAVFKSGDSDDEDTSYLDIINPKSKSFLKLSIRGTDINLDVSGGMSEFQRLLFWSWANLAYSAATEDLEGFTNTAETLAQNESNTFLSTRFARAKLSPIASLGVDVATGSDYLGHPINRKEGGYWGAVTSRMAPLTYQGIYDSLTYDENRSLIKEPKTAAAAYERLMRFNADNIPAALLLGALQGVGISATQYEKSDKSIAEDTAWAMWQNKFEAKDPRLNRVKTNLRNLFRKKLQLEKRGKDTKAVDSLIEEIKEKYKDLPKAKLMEAKDQAKQGKFDFVTKSFDESQIKRIMQFATEPEQRELEKILKEKAKAKKKKKR